jgi:hypothetical protein
VCVVPWAILLFIFNVAGKLVGGVPIDTDIIASPGPAVLCCAFGWMFGLLAWRDEPPKRRAYHWTLPVDRSKHDLSRIAAYALWLMVGITTYMAVGVAILVFYHVPFDLAAAGFTPWVAPYVAGLIGFGISAAVATVTEKPLEYFVAALAAGFSLGLLARIYNLHVVTRALEAVFSPSSSYSITSTVLNPGIASSTRLLGHSPDVAVMGPLLLWLAIAVTCVAAAPFVNRGRSSR